MSIQAATRFLEQLANDDDVKTALDLEGKTRQERIAAVVELAGKRGFDFTEDECTAVLETGQKVRDGQLEDAELEAVAGGVLNKDDTIALAIYQAATWLTGDDDDDEDEDSDRMTTCIAGVRG